jgi:hypothetical protein
MPHPERGEHRPDYRTFLAAYERAWRSFQEDPTEHTLGVLRAGEEILTRELFKPGKFELGQLVMTPGANQAMHTAGHIPPEFLRHPPSHLTMIPPGVSSKPRSRREAGSAAPGSAG